MRHLALLVTVLVFLIPAAQILADEAQSTEGAKSDKIDVKAEVNPWRAELEDPETAVIFPGADRLTSSDRSERIYSKADSSHIWVSATTSWVAEAPLDTIVSFYRKALIENSWEIVSVITFSGTARIEALRADEKAILVEMEPRGDVANRISLTLGSPSMVVKKPGEREEAAESSQEEEEQEEKDVRTHEIIIW
jgi:pyruvate kinase